MTILDRLRRWLARFHQHPALPYGGTHHYVWTGTVVHRHAKCLTCGRTIRRITAQGVEPVVWVHWP